MDGLLEAVDQIRCVGNKSWPWRAAQTQARLAQLFRGKNQYGRLTQITHSVHRLADLFIINPHKTLDIVLQNVSILLPIDVMTLYILDSAEHPFGPSAKPPVGASFSAHH